MLVWTEARVQVWSSRPLRPSRIIGSLLNHPLLLRQLQEMALASGWRGLTANREYLALLMPIGRCELRSSVRKQQGRYAKSANPMILESFPNFRCLAPYLAKYTCPGHLDGLLLASMSVFIQCIDCCLSKSWWQKEDSTNIWQVSSTQQSKQPSPFFWTGKTGVDAYLTAGTSV